MLAMSIRRPTCTSAIKPSWLPPSKAPALPIRPRWRRLQPASDSVSDGRVEARLESMASAERRTFMASDSVTTEDVRGDSLPFFRPGESYVDEKLLRRQHLTERTAGFVLLACAAVSVLTTIGIVIILLAQAVNFFDEVPIREFLTGTTWTALFPKQ